MVRAGPAASIRGPAICPAAIAALRTTSRLAGEPALRAVVTPPSSARRAMPGGPEHQLLDGLDVVQQEAVLDRRVDRVVGVAVDQAGQQRRTRGVDHGRVRRCHPCRIGRLDGGEISSPVTMTSRPLRASPAEPVDESRVPKDGRRGCATGLEFSRQGALLHGTGVGLSTIYGRRPTRGNVRYHRAHGDQRTRRTTRRSVDAGRRRPAGPARTTSCARTRRSRPSASRSGRPATAVPSFNARLQRGPHRRPRPRRSAATARARARTARCSSARTRTPCPSRPSGRRWRCSPRTTSTSASMPPTATRRRPVISHAILVHNRGRARPPGRRHRRHAVAQPARGRRLQVQPAERRPGRHRRHRAGSRTRRTGCSRRTSTASAASRSSRPARAAHGRPRLRREPTSTTWPRSSTWTPSAAPAFGSASIRSAAPASPTGRRSRERYGLDLTVTNDVVDPQFAFMTCDWDGADPDGPVVAVRDGPAGRAARPVRRRLRQRHRRRSARDRHAGRRTAEPEPLPVGCGRATCSAAAATGAATWPSARRSCRARMIDRVAGRPRAPRCSRCRSGSSGSSTGLVDGEPRVRRRGERRRLVPAPRRHGLDDRQGRDHRLPAGGRDDRADRPRPGRGLPRR